MICQYFLSFWVFVFNVAEKTCEGKRRDVEMDSEGHWIPAQPLAREPWCTKLDCPFTCCKLGQPSPLLSLSPTPPQFPHLGITLLTRPFAPSPINERFRRAQDDATVLVASSSFLPPTDLPAAWTSRRWSCSWGGPGQVGFSLYLHLLDVSQLHLGIPQGLVPAFGKPKDR